MRCSARSSLRQQAQNLPPGGDCGGQFDVAAGGLAFGLGGFRLDAQPRRQVGLAEAERLLEEAACLSAQCGAALGRRPLQSRRIDPCLCRSAL